MAIMKYETPDVTKIDFEDNIFVTTGFDSYKNKEVKEYIESQGGLVKDSVTKATNYLIYECGQEETTKYKKAQELVWEKGLDIVLISSYSFMRLITMHYETSGITEIDFEDNIFVTTELGSDRYHIEQYIEGRGGIVKRSITKNTNYLIYEKGKYPTKEYKKALELKDENGLDIKLLSFNTFKTLIPVMSYETSGDTKIDFAHRTFVFTGFEQNDNKGALILIETRDGHIEEQVSNNTDYLIYADDTWETQDYLTALEMLQRGETDIVIHSLREFLVMIRGEAVMEFGTYPFDTDGMRKPIKWVVLERHVNKALLLAAYGLDSKPYNKERTDITWEDCTLRKWLNDEFLNSAFSEEERRQIIMTKLENANNPRYNTPGGNDTEDKIFLLSLDEVEKYLPAGVQRQVAPTPYAVKRGAMRDLHKNYNWWLRSPGNSPSNVAYVHGGGGIWGGGISDCDSRIKYDTFAICPAIWVELE